MYTWKNFGIEMIIPFYESTHFHPSNLMLNQI